MIFNEHVKIREEKFGTVIFETLREKIFITNQIGKEILSLLEKGHAPDEVINILSEKYSDDNGQIKNDVTDFVEQLKENKILTF